MNIEEMNLEELETRSLEIAEEVREADKETIERLNAELDSIEERKAVLQKEIEDRAKAIEEVIKMEGEKLEEAEERKMTDREIRSSKEHKWVWTLLVVLQTFVNMWFAFLPNSYSVAFLMLSIVAWLVIGVAQKA